MALMGISILNVSPAVMSLRQGYGLDAADDGTDTKFTVVSDEAPF